MRHARVSGAPGFTLLSMCIFAFALAINAQASPAAGTSVQVKLLELMDSGSDPAGRQYRGAVAQTVNAGNGVVIPQGAAATLVLVSVGASYSSKLTALSIDGQTIAVSSGSATLSAVTQGVQARAASTVNSVLGGFGHHLHAPSGIATAAAGQRVYLPVGTTLTFVLSQAPAPPPAAAEVAAAAPQGPQAHPAAPAAAFNSATAYYALCRYQGQKSGHPIAYVTPIIHADGGVTDLSLAFNKYMTAKYDLSGIQYGSGYCRTLSNSPAQQANSMDMIEKQWAASKTEVIHVDWNGTQAESGAGDSAAKPAHDVPAITASAAPAGKGPFISCSTSGGAGINIYLTGVFQTSRPVRHMPSGGNLVDQAVLDHFYAYLKAQGYSFKPGSNYGCDVSKTEEQAKAAQHKRAYEGGGCSTCGKTIETGWKDE